MIRSGCKRETPSTNDPGVTLYRTPWETSTDTDTAGVPRHIAWLMAAVFLGDCTVDGRLSRGLHYYSSPIPFLVRVPSEHDLLRIFCSEHAYGWL